MARKKAAQRVRTGDRIQGLVASTAGAGGPRDFWLILHLRPWIDAGGTVQPKELRVTVPRKTKASMHRAIHEWQGKPVSLKVSKAWGPTKNRLESAEAASLRGVEADPRLVPKVSEQAKPRLFQDRALGTLELERDLGCLTGWRRTSKLDYEVLIEAVEPDDVAALWEAVEQARKALLQVEKRLPRIREAVADQLLDVCNEGWREGKPPLSRRAFKRSLTPSGSHVYDDGSMILYLSGGEAFEDHVVELRFTRHGKIGEVLVAG